jgi:hypothetical protein
LAIPLYEAIYYYYSGEFFHSTIQHEQYFENDELIILSTMKDNMVKNYKEVNNTDSLKPELLNYRNAMAGIPSKGLDNY